MLDSVDLERLIQVGSHLSLGSLVSEVELIQTVFNNLQCALDGQLVGMLLLAPFEGLYYTAEELPKPEICLQLELHLREILDSLEFTEGLPEQFRHQTLPGQRAWERPNLDQFIGLPIMVEGRIGGLLFATRGLEQKPFSGSDWTILAMLCGQLSVTWLVLNLNRQLAEKNQKLQALHQYREEFIRNLSHDLRTPLTCILGYTELLQQYGPKLEVEQQSEFLGHILTKSKSLRILVDNLLDFNASQSLKPILAESIDLKACLQQVVIDIQPLLTEKQQRLRIKVPQLLPNVQGEQGLIIRVLINLLHNSQKFAPLGSELLVEVYRKGAMVQISVQDNGPGLAPEALERVFEKFHRESHRPVQSSEEGIGLGLAVCRDIVEAFEGRIWAECCGEGTAFCFELRVAP